MLVRASAVVVLLGASAHAAPEEIQIYMDEMNAPGQFGLDVHNNYVATGHSIDDYSGEQQSLHRYRITPEFAYGLTRSFELGLYLPLATIDRDGLGIDGLKLRLKFIAPKRRDQTWFWGANFEIGGVDHELDLNPYNAELKGIVGLRSGRWTVAFNANLDFKVYGPASSPPSVDLDLKLSYLVTKTVALGVETYDDPFGLGDDSSFVTLDTSWGGWDLDLGVGSGYGTNPDRFLVKAIVGIPID
jgi:hypothetical protein